MTTFLLTAALAAEPGPARAEVRAYGEVTSLLLIHSIGAAVEWRFDRTAVSVGAGASAFVVADASWAALNTRVAVHGFTPGPRCLEVSVGVGPSFVLPETTFTGERIPLRVWPWPTLFIGYRNEPADGRRVVRVGVGSELGAVGLIVGYGGRFARRP